MLLMLVLRDEQLEDHINDTSLVRTKAGNKLRSFELSGFAILHIVHSLAAAAKRRRLTSQDQLIQLVDAHVFAIETLPWPYSPKRIWTSLTVAGLLYLEVA